MAKQKSKKARRAIVLGQTALGITSGIETVQIVDGFSVSVNGLTVNGEQPFEQWELLTKTLRVAERGIQFALGDLAIQAEVQLGEKASQLLSADDFDHKTIEVYRWIASRIASDIRRMDRLGIRHHMLVAALTPAKQRKWLTEAANDEGEKPWTVARLKAALEAGHDVPASEWYIWIGPLQSGQIQSELMDRLEAEGLTVKAVERHAKKTDELTDGDGEV